MKKKIIVFIILITFSWINLFAQDDKDKKEAIRTDADLRSGNYRDVLTNFFQLAFNDLTKEDKKFQFSSNLFAIKLKTNPDLDIDENFKNQTFWRNTNIDFGIKLDSAYKFNGSKIGIRYAFINKRDYAIAKNFREEYITTMAYYDEVFNKVMDAVSSQFGDDEKRLTQYNQEVYDFIKLKTKKFKELSDPIKKIFNSIVPDKNVLVDDYNFGDEALKEYEKLKKGYDNKLLCVFTTNANTYSNGLLLENLDFGLQATAKMMKLGEHSHIEFDVKSVFAFLNDSTIKNRNLKRSTFNFEGGANIVFKNKNNSKPVVEFKASTSYLSILNGKYLGEKQNIFTFNGTLRLRITDNIWIPIAIKYDPDMSNVFGVMSVKLNFDMLGK